MATRGIQTTELVVFLLISLIVRGAPDCTTPEVFNQENSKVIETTYQKEMNARSYQLLHEYLYDGEIIEDNYPDSDYFDKLSSFLGGSMIKKVDIEEDSEISTTEHEVKMMRELCGVPRENFSEKRNCKNDFIADFNGCVIDDQDIYLFVATLENNHILSRDDEKFWMDNFLNRVPIMLDIIDLFIGLHKIGYVHSDIKSENIMSGMDTRDFKILGLQYTNKVGEKFLGGTKEQLAPERRLKDSTAAGLTVQEDI